MPLDVNTLFMVTMHIEIMLGLLLFFAWAQNFSKTALGWWGTAHLLRAISVVLFGMHGSLPDWISLDIANALLFGSFAVTWSGARVFDQRSTAPVWSTVGVAIWLLACRLPEFSGTMELRALLGSGIVTAYTWLAAYEFWRGRDEALVSRWPAIFMLFAHGALFLLRTPLGVLLQMSENNAFAMSGWLELLSLEGLLFTISIAFILLAMAKERTELRHRTAAATDALTGIANRRGFFEQSTASKRWTKDRQPTGVLLIDIDRFKSVNDQFGHAIGDRVLQTFAEAAKSVIGPSGLIGRWGGDEFAAVLYDTGRDRALSLAERIQREFQMAASEIDGHTVRATLSIGMVFSAAGPLDLASLLSQADQALYRAKEAGRNRIELAVPECVWTADKGQPSISAATGRPKSAA
jgi:diguanylate cyclase (GGDEF)-like protein